MTLCMSVCVGHVRYVTKCAIRQSLNANLKAEPHLTCHNLLISHACILVLSANGRQPLRKQLPVSCVRCIKLNNKTETLEAGCSHS